MAFIRTFQTVDMHAGVPMRVVTGGVPHIPGKTVFEKMKWLEKNDDQLRKLLLREPRGYPPQCLNVIVPPSHEKADAGYIIMEQGEYCLMSGWNTIAVTTALLETGMLPIKGPETKLVLEAPGGLVEVTAHCTGKHVDAVTFRNMPCFVAHKGVELEIPHVGTAIVDVVWAGVWFVLADIANFKDVVIEPKQGKQLARITALMCRAAQDKLPVHHPEFGDIPISLGTLYGKHPNGSDEYNTCSTMLFGKLDYDNPSTWSGALDRSPCGTGTCARMAALHAHGKLALGETFKHESIIGLVGQGKLIDTCKVGDFDAVIPEVTGSAWICGLNTFVLDETDPFPEGFTVGDIW